MKKALPIILGVIMGIVITVGLCLFGMYKCSSAVVETIDETIEESNDVNNYLIFIEDEVRFELANAHPDFAYMDLDNIELQSKADSKISNIASQYDADQPSYKMALQKVIAEGNSYEKKYAKQLLEIYNGLQLDFTPFESVAGSSSQWTFQEKNSRVHFETTVGIICLCSGDTWDLDRYTEYLETGIFPAVPGEEAETDNTLDENTCIKLAFCIPDGGMAESARAYFTEDYLRAWDGITALPDVAEYAGYLPEKEWIYYFVQGNAGFDVNAHILSIVPNKSGALVSFYYSYVDYTSDKDYPHHTMQLIRRNNVWLIDEYDTTKQEMLDWIANATSEYLNGSHWKELLVDSTSIAQFQQQMENYLNSSVYKSVIQNAE